MKDAPVHLLALPGALDTVLSGIDHDGPIGIASFFRPAGKSRMRLKAAWDLQGREMKRKDVPRKLIGLSSEGFVHGQYGLVHARTCFSFVDHTIYGYPERMLETNDERFIVSRDFIFHRTKRPGEDPRAPFFGGTRWGIQVPEIDTMHKITALYLRTPPPLKSSHARMAWHARTKAQIDIIKVQGFSDHETVAPEITWMPDTIYEAAMSL